MSEESEVKGEGNERRHTEHYEEWNEHGHGKRIGELNGPWAFLFKLFLITVPIILTAIIAWGVWATQRIHSIEIWQGEVRSWIQQGPRFTAIDAQALELRVNKASVEIMDRKFAELEKSLNRLELTITELTVTLKQHVQTKDK